MSDDSRHRSKIYTGSLTYNKSFGQFVEILLDNDIRIYSPYSVSKRNEKWIRITFNNHFIAIFLNNNLVKYRHCLETGTFLTNHIYLLFGLASPLFLLRNKCFLLFSGVISLFLLDGIAAITGNLYFVNILKKKRTTTLFYNLNNIIYSSHNTRFIIYEIGFGMAHQNITKSVLNELLNYFFIKRLEEGFDLSNSKCPRRKHPNLKKLSTLRSVGLNDVPLKHYFKNVKVKQILTNFSENKYNKQLKSTKLFRQIEKIHACEMKRRNMYDITRPFDSTGFFGSNTKRKECGYIMLRSTKWPFTKNLERKRLSRIASCMLDALLNLPFTEFIMSQIKEMYFYIFPRPAESIFHLATAFMACLSVTVLYKLIRPLFSARVNCWFCNTFQCVDYKKRNSYDCSKCQQYNGFNKDGSYNKEMNEFYCIDHLNDSYTTESQSAKSHNSSFNRNRNRHILCKSCQNNQLLIIRQIANFIPKIETQTKKKKKKKNKIKTNNEINVLDSYDEIYLPSLNGTDEASRIIKISTIEEFIPTIQKMDYVVKFKTGSQKGSGRYGPIELQLIGHDGKMTDTIKLNVEENSKLLDNSSSYFYLNVEDFGQPTSFSVGHNDTNEDSCWFLDSCQIYEGDTNVCYIANCKKWLSPVHDDRKTHRTFTLTEDNSNNQNFKKIFDHRNEELKHSKFVCHSINSLSLNSSLATISSSDTTVKSNSDHELNSFSNFSVGESTSMDSDTEVSLSVEKLDLNEDSIQSKSNIKDSNIDSITSYNQPSLEQSISAKSSDMDIVESTNNNNYDTDNTKSTKHNDETETIQSVIEINPSDLEKFINAIKDGEMKTAINLYYAIDHIIDYPDKNNLLPIHIAVKHKQYDILRWICKQCPSCIDKYNFLGYNALHMTCIGRDIQCMKILIEEGCNLICKTEDKKSPLHLCVQSDFLIGLKYLISCGASSYVFDQYGTSVIEFAKECNNVLIVEFLIRSQSYTTNEKKSSLSNALNNIEIENINKKVIFEKNCSSFGSNGNFMP
ncbi:hypothetical protein A3Q56_05260 [Intoshia linei]|uniref:PLAT domain-containing protein n=1 Tax=Intoshia linei TaxID=1819745 RepID=A0A177AY61_9BILA|nr:hypothetical protein A3Q56_05260 [Intoshia linei]